MTIVYYFEKQGFIVHAIIRDGRREVQLPSSMISTQHSLVPHLKVLIPFSSSLC